MTVLLSTIIGIGSFTLQRHIAGFHENVLGCEEIVGIYKPLQKQCVENPSSNNPWSKCILLDFISVMHRLLSLARHRWSEKKPPVFTITLLLLRNCFNVPCILAFHWFLGYGYCVNGLEESIEGFTKIFLDVVLLLRHKT